MSEIDTWIAERGYSPQRTTDDYGLPINPTPGMPYEVINSFGQGETWMWVAGEIDPFTQKELPGGWKRLGTTDLHTGGGAGATWRPGEQAMAREELDLNTTHNYIQDSLDRLTEERNRLNDEWTRAYQAGDIALRTQVENRTAANEAQLLALQEQQMQVDIQIAQGNNAASVYGTQMGARSSLASTMTDLAKTEADWRANPRDAFAYLGLVNSTQGSATPFSSATAPTNQAYGQQLTQAGNETFGPPMAELRKQMASTYDYPEEVTRANTAATQAAQPWYAQLPNYLQSTAPQQALYKSLPVSQQRFLANATPEQLAYLRNLKG